MPRSQAATAAPADALVPRGRLPLLGGLSARRFLSEYWQKKPLLVRQAIPGFAGLIDAAGLRRLAASEDVQSRLIQRQGRSWSLQHGPIAARTWKDLDPAQPWTVLVQELNFHLPAADRLLEAFRFIPHARIDDLMVSHASPRGGVGPHFDSYDVFLLQGPGRRRWRISAQEDVSLRAGMPLKILKHFHPEQEWVLEPGDMLYLPPRYAHDGVALDECFTYSIGFRAPGPQEWVAEFLLDHAERLRLDGRYADPDLQLQRHPGALPRALQTFFQQQLDSVRFEAAAVRDFNGRYLTEPKPHVFFPAPLEDVSPSGFRRAALTHGVRLDPRSRMLFAGSDCWCNGEHFPMAGDEQAVLVALADRRRLDAASLRAGQAASPDQWRSTLWPMLLAWFDDGWLRLGCEWT